jgi:hypothetical protein
MKTFGRRDGTNEQIRIWCFIEELLFAGLQVSTAVFLMIQSFLGHDL